MSGVRRDFAERRASKVGRLASCGLALLLWSSAVGAQPSEPERQQARAYMNEGERLFQAGDLEGALRSYAAGHDIMHVPTTGYEVAKVHALLGQLVEANLVLVEVVNHPVGPGEPPVFAEARQNGSQLMAELEQRIPRLTITVSPAQAQVFHGDRALPPETLTAPYRVNPGQVLLAARADGHRDASAELTLSEREARTVHLQLEPLPVEPPPEVVLAPRADPDQDRLLRAYIGFGVGGLGFAVAGVTGAMSLGAASDAREHCDGNDCTRAAQNDIESSKTLANVANVGFVVGLLGAGYGVYEYFLNAPEEPTPPPVVSESGLQASPFVGVGAEGRDAMIGVRGGF